MEKLQYYNTRLDCISPLIICDLYIIVDVKEKTVCLKRISMSSLWGLDYRALVLDIIYRSFAQPKVL